MKMMMMGYISKTSFNINEIKYNNYYNHDYNVDDNNILKIKTFFHFVLV